MEKEEKIYKKECYFGCSDDGFVSEFYWADLEATKKTGNIEVALIDAINKDILFRDTMTFEEWEKFKKKLENDNYDVTEYILKGMEGKR